jgi:hypothetical protein
MSERLALEGVLVRWCSRSQSDADRSLRPRVHFASLSYGRVWVPLVACVGMALSGCWTPPSADVRPGGRPRVIEKGIEVEHGAGAARIESLDPVARTVVLSVRGTSLPACRIGRGVRHWRRLHSGDRVRARIEEVLTVYVPPANEPARAHGGARARAASARVLTVDPSYRLLTLQYANGGTETFKIGLHTRMGGIRAGDSVTVRPVEVLELRARRRASREKGSRSSPSARPAR